MIDQDQFYITTPIYYVNDRPHIGHAYTTILGDVLARYYRLLNRPTFFLTGTDEHGQKVFEAARRHGIEPQEQCDRTVVRFQDLWRKLEITNDDFIRTTEQRHVRVVQTILEDLYRRDQIYAAEYEGWYCVGCERFYMQKDLLDNHCPECSRAVEQLLERNYFFRMSTYQDWLIEYIETHPEFIQPAHRRQETLGFLRSPLNDLCISRPKSRMSWGIELPFDSDYVTYVWFDALVNYISGIGYHADPEKFSRWWPASCHLIGKDILTTHTVYWPTMLKAMGLDMPQTIFAHGWWLVGRDKMSKSLGNVVNPMEMAERYGVDPFRYFLMAEMTLGQDASFTQDSFFSRYNADLANDLGNLASRVMRMIERNLDSRLPAAPPETEEERPLKQACLRAVSEMRRNLLAMRIDRGLAEVMAAVREGNRYFEKNAPWQMARTGDLQGLSRVLCNAAECLRIVSGLLFPVMPEKMAELRRGLGMTENEIAPDIDRLADWGRGRGEVGIRPVGALFPRIDTAAEQQIQSGEITKSGPGKVEEKVRTKQKTKKAAAALAPEGLIEYSDFARIQLRAALVVAAEPVPEADRLLCLQVDLGKPEPRQIVAGIAKSYAPAELIGRTVIVVANLSPARIRGVESHGMLLAGKGKDGQFTLVTTEIPLAPGSHIG